MTDEPEKPKLRRGFAVMSPERRKEIATKGGASLRPEQRAFSQNRELAVEAGRRGGESSTRGKAKPKAEPTP